MTAVKHDLQALRRRHRRTIEHRADAHSLPDRWAPDSWMKGEHHHGAAKGARPVWRIMDKVLIGPMVALNIIWPTSPSEKVHAQKVLFDLWTRAHHAATTGRHRPDDQGRCHFA